MSRRRGRKYANHRASAKMCRAHPGEWVYVTTYPSLAVARSMVSTIRGGSSNHRIDAYEPGGDFDGKHEMADDGWDVYAMYLGDGEQTCASTASP